MSKRIVELHKGALRARSMADEGGDGVYGSCFVVELPMPDQERDVSALAAATTMGSAANGEDGGGGGKAVPSTKQMELRQGKCLQIAEPPWRIKQHRMTLRLNK